MNQIIITLVEDNKDLYSANGWKVEFENRYAYGLSYDEMIGVVSMITMPEDRPCLRWLKTAEQHKVWEDRVKSHS